MNSRRMNRLEELGRVDAEKADTKKGARNLKDEKKRIVRELKADGGKVKPKRRKAGPKAGRPAAKKKRVMPIISSSETHSRQKDGSMKKTQYRYSADDGKAQTYTNRRGKAVKYDNAPFKTIDSRTYGLRAGGKVLKPVQPNQKGLKKLPTKVRNKMGYMKKGGRVGMGKAMRGGGCVR
jgi:hypothetical protein